MSKSFKLNNGTTVYMEPDMFADNANTLEAISDYLLRNCREIHSISFSDVGANGIQVGGVHNFNPGYLYMIKTIKYDFSNINEIVKEFVKDWNKSTLEQIENFKRFTKDGEKYGWD